MKPHFFAALSKYTVGIMLVVSQTLAHADDKPALGLFDVYEQNRQTGVANLITPDLLLVSYSLIRERGTIDQERDTIIPAFSTVIHELSTVFAGHKNKSPAHKRAYAYLLTLSGLLDGKKPDPLKGFDSIEQEWSLLEAQQGIAESPVLGVKIDYSQLQARGRYTQNNALQNYFRAFRYASLAHFFAQGSTATGVSPTLALELSQAARLLSEAIAKSNKIQSNYQTLSQALKWQYGQKTELNYQDMLAVKAIMPEADWKNSEKVASALTNYARQYDRAHKIYDYPVDTGKLAPGQTIADVLIGWRLFSPAFNNDTAAYQALIYPATGSFQSPCGTLACVQPWTLATIDGMPVKAYARGTELLAALAIPAALQASRSQGEHLFAHYQQAQQQAAQLLQTDNGLNQLQLQFLQTAGQSLSRLESLLGFWTWQRYINLLYSKQSMTMTAKSMSMPSAESRPGAMLTGSPDFYRALATLVQSHRQLQPQTYWDNFLALLQQLEQLSGRAATLAADDERFLNDIDKTLLTLTKHKDKPIIVDIHTNPVDKMTIEEAIGLPDIIQQNKARGAQLRHYEFKQPQDQRLDNDQWLHALLAQDK